MTEEDVFKESNGGHGWMAAYWVVYVNEEIEQKLKDCNINRYKYSEGMVIDHSHPYSSKIPGEINMKIEDENKKLRDEITDQ